MGTHVPLPRALARALAACVVLIGLFLMHGLPGSNCAGRPDGGVSSMTSALSMAYAPMMPAATSLAAMTYPSMAPTPNPLAQSVEAAELAVGASVAGSAAVSGSASVSAIGPRHAGTGMAGALCVSRPPSIGVAGFVALLLVVGVLAFGEVAGLAGPTGRFPRGRGLRAPPPAGAVLLVRLCISRT